MREEEGTRERIRREIVLNPGLHFRELQRRLSLPTGVIEYHLNRLVHEGLVEAVKDGKYVRYYPAMSLPTVEKKLLKALRKGTVRRILLLLAEGPKSGSEISRTLGITPATVSHHLSYLEKEGIVRSERQGRSKVYSLNDRERLITVLMKFKRGFMDKLVDNFLEGFLSD